MDAFLKPFEVLRYALLCAFNPDAQKFNGIYEN
jgi:hypothetical protein